MSTRSPVRSRRVPGCLILIGVLLACEIGNAARLLVPNAINRAKWEQHQITHYRAVVSVSAFIPTMGDNEIEVENGVVISGRHGDWSEDLTELELCSAENDCDPSYFDSLTFERMFEIPSGCLWLFPLLICTYGYNWEYGYPEQVDWPCTMFAGGASECGHYRDTIEFEPLE